jgi:hypothetical protein
MKGKVISESKVRESAIFAILDKNIKEVVAYSGRKKCGRASYVKFSILVISECRGMFQRGSDPHGAHDLGESLTTLRKCKLSLYLHL